MPPVVRAYLTSGRCSAVARDLMIQYGLHIDQGGIFERELMLLIMGIESPEAFLDALEHEAGIPDDVARNLTADINRDVFIPMRDEMRRSDSVPNAPAAPPPQPRVQVPPPSYGASPPPRPAPPSPPVPLPPPLEAFVPPPRPGPAITLPPLPPAGATPAELIPRAADGRGGAPLPPRTVLPGASAPVFHHPMPPPLGEPLVATPSGSDALGRPEVLAPPNLPTGLPAPSATDAGFNPLPPLVRPMSPPPPRPTSSDPYHEPIE